MVQHHSFLRKLPPLFIYLVLNNPALGWLKCSPHARVVSQLHLVVYNIWTIFVAVCDADPAFCGITKFSTSLIMAETTWLSIVDCHYYTALFIYKVDAKSINIQNPLNHMTKNSQAVWTFSEPKIRRSNWVSLRSQHVHSIFVFAAGASMSQKNESIDHCQNKIEKQYLFLHIIHGYTL